MRERHKEGLRASARATLAWCKIPVGADFHTLRSEHIDALLTAADVARYQKPRNANGSRARYFHDLMQRRAKMET